MWLWSVVPIPPNNKSKAFTLVGILVGVYIIICDERGEKKRGISRYTTSTTTEMTSDNNSDKRRGTMGPESTRLAEQELPQLLLVLQ